MPVRSEPARTMDRLMAHPEATQVAPWGRKPTCTCMACSKCVDRVRLRLKRKGIVPGTWTSDRARAALEDRLSGLSWAEVAERHGYRNATTCQHSVAAITTLTEQEKAQLSAIPPAKRRARIEVVAGPVAPVLPRNTRIERLTDERTRMADEALRAYRHGASKDTINGMLALLDRYDSRIAALSEADTATSTEERRAAVAVARTATKVNGTNGVKGERKWTAGSLPSKATNPATAKQRAGLRELSIRRAPAAGG